MSRLEHRREVRVTHMRVNVNDGAIGRAAGFHVAFVVSDVDRRAAEYQRLLGGSFHSWEFVKAPPVDIDATLTDSHLRVAYGRFAGMTIELIQVLSGRGIHAAWFEEHGEGVHHLGFWVPELAPALAASLQCGATLISAKLDRDRVDWTDVDSQPPDHVAGCLLPGAIHIRYGVPSVELELLGPSTVAELHNRLGDQLHEIVDLPPWA